MNAATLERPAAFLTTLACERFDGDELFTLTKPLIYRSKVADTVFVVPASFRTNFVTGREIPGVAWLAGTLSEEASALHDWLYSSGEVSREMADKVFLEALGVVRKNVRAREKADGVAAWRRGISNTVDGVKNWLMYAGVRIGGESHYKGGERAQPVDNPADDLYRG